MASSSLLSICIPTYNRHDFLHECLNSIVSQCDHNIEVVISDNASTDNTEALVQSFQERLNIKYYKNSENIGFDRNCLNVVDKAAGEYCLILGSDDCLVDDYIETIFNVVNKNNGVDVIHYGYKQCGIDIHQVKNSVKVSKYEHNIEMDTLKSDYYSYLSSLNNTSCLFTFISSFVFRRSLWEKVKNKDRYVDTQYVHTFIVHNILKNGCNLYSLPKALVFARGGNPNEWNVEPGKLFALDVNTFGKIISDIYSGNSLVGDAIGRVFRRNYSAKTIVSILCLGGKDNLSRCLENLPILEYSKVFISFLKIAISNKILLSILHTLYSLYKMVAGKL